MTKLLLTLVFGLATLLPVIATGEDAPTFALSPYFHVPDGLPQDYDPLSFRYEWTLQKPYTLSVQFTNAGYKTLPLKFALRDLTRHETLLLDAKHNAYYIQEILGVNADDKLWTAEVADPHDLFSLRIWNIQGDFVDQLPFRLKPAWEQSSSSSSVAPVLETDPALPPIRSPQMSRLLDDLKHLARTPSVKDPTAGLYAALGDSYTEGYGSSSPRASFYSLSFNELKVSNPALKPYRKIIKGCSPQDWAAVIPDALNGVRKRWDTPIRYVLFQTGISCFFKVHHNDDSCRGASTREGVAYSYVYQRNMEQDITALYRTVPSAVIVVTDIPDTSGGGGHYAPAKVYEAYRQRLLELKTKFPQLRVADIYQATLGHTEYFHHEYDDKDHPNDLGQAVIAKCILEQFLK